jgi:hypothetical protein
MLFKKLLLLRNLIKREIILKKDFLTLIVRNVFIFKKMKKLDPLFVLRPNKSFRFRFKVAKDVNKIGDLLK